MSPAAAFIENVWQLLKMKLRKKKFYKLSIFDWCNKTRTTLVYGMNNRISQVTKSDDDFI